MLLPGPEIVEGVDPVEFADGDQAQEDVAYFGPRQRFILKTAVNAKTISSQRARDREMARGEGAQPLSAGRSGRLARNSALRTPHSSGPPFPAARLGVSSPGRSSAWAATWLRAWCVVRAWHSHVIQSFALIPP